MAISVKQARDFVYGNGTLWERALFDHLFQGGSLTRLHQCLLCYKNADNGWGHALEHDIRTPESHPLALEFLLNMMAHTGIQGVSLLNGTPGWLEANQNPDGSLKNPPSVLDYPHAFWWDNGGQDVPASIVGNLTRLGVSTPALTEATRRWAARHMTLEQIQANEWLFMAYRPHDYYFSTDDFPQVEVYRKAVIQNIITCAEKMPQEQYYVLFNFVMHPESPAAQAIPRRLIDRSLDHLMDSQQEDGGWKDEHGLPQWRPYVTIQALLALRNYGRITI